MDDVDRFDYLFKILVTGDSGVGKSSLLMRFVADTFEPYHVVTIGMDFKMRTIQLEGGKVVKLQLWDTAGQEKYQTMSTSYYRNAHGVIVVYDITNRRTFDDVPKWLGEVRDWAQPNVVKMLVGNKSDKGERAVDYVAAKEFAHENGMLYIETSAKGATNVDVAFHSLARQIATSLDLLQPQRSDTISMGAKGRGGGSDESCCTIS